MSWQKTQLLWEVFLGLSRNRNRNENGASNTFLWSQRNESKLTDYLPMINLGLDIYKRGHRHVSKYWYIIYVTAGIIELIWHIKTISYNQLGYFYLKNQVIMISFMSYPKFKKKTVKFIIKIYLNDDKAFNWEIVFQILLVCI